MVYVHIGEKSEIAHGARKYCFDADWATLDRYAASHRGFGRAAIRAKLVRAACGWYCNDPAARDALIAQIEQRFQ